MPWALRVVLTWGLVAVIGWLDILTGTEMVFSECYLLPIFLAAWFGGLPEGIAAALVSIIVWSMVNEIEHAEEHWSPYVHVWNAVSPFVVYLLFVYILNRLRVVLTHEKEMASKDPLTGAFNSRQFYALANRELERSRRTGESLTVVYFDVDDSRESTITLATCMAISCSAWLPKS